MFIKMRARETEKYMRTFIVVVLVFIVSAPEGRLSALLNIFDYRKCNSIRALPVNFSN